MEFGPFRCTRSVHFLNKKRLALKNIAWDIQHGEWKGQVWIDSDFKDELCQRLRALEMSLGSKSNPLIEELVRLIVSLEEKGDDTDLRYACILHVSPCPLSDLSNA